MTKPVLKKFENIQALRGVAVIMVVLCHLQGVETFFGSGPGLLPKFFLHGAYGVDIFFVISGFIMATITRGQFQNLNNAARFAFHRITRIYPLYWLYTLLIFLSIIAHKYILGHVIPNYHYDLFRSLFLIPQSQSPMLAVGWTLIYEMYFYGVITLLLFLPERLFIKSIIFWAILIFIVHYVFKPTGIYLTTASNPLVFEFMAGCLIARMPYPSANTLSYFLFATSFIMLFAGFYYPHLLNPMLLKTWEAYPIQNLLLRIPYVLMVYALVTLEINKIILPKFMIKLGDASYSTYLSHPIVYVIFGSVWQKFTFINQLPYQIAILIIMLIAVITYGFISYHYIEKPMIRFFRNLAERWPVSSALKAQQ